MAEVSRRNSVKNIIIRVKRFTNGADFENGTRQLLTTKLELLEKSWTQFVDLQILVEEITGPENLQFEEAEMMNTEEMYTSAKASILRKLDEFSSPNVVEIDRPNIQDYHRESALHASELQLPRIDLPRFSGDYSQWPEFHDLFTSLIDQRASLSGAQKLHYLKSNLDGQASQLIRSYQITNANYSEAWEALKSRYDNKRQIVFTHFNNLYDQPVAAPGSSLDLRRILDTSQESIRALKVLKFNTDTWGPMLVYFIMKKLDSESREQLELSLDSVEVPTMEEITNFVEKRCRALDCKLRSHDNVNTSHSKQKKNPLVSEKTTKTFVSTSSSSCSLCKGNHFLWSCSEFIKMDLQQRNKSVRDHSLCINCLRPGHRMQSCRSSKCRKCKSSHHTLLHRDKTLDHHQTVQRVAAPLNETVSNLGTPYENNAQVLLATAYVQIKASDGSAQLVRALIDTGSQSCFITDECAQRLRLKRKHTSIKINGLGSTNAATSRGLVNIDINSTTESFETTMTALIINKITNTMPSRELSELSSEFNSIKLADPNFFKPGKIDLLLGADVYSELITDGVIHSKSLLAQRTKLGWIISGSVFTQKQSFNFHATNLHLQLELENTLKKFWEVEEFPEILLLTNEEKACEQHFTTTHYRNENGRFVVDLPFKPNASSLGNSKNLAMKRFHHLERKLKAHPTIKQGYIDFMHEYEDLDHMELISAPSEHSPDKYYIPHHCVIKESSSTTKLRVVFDASAKSSSGISLNDNLMVGPKLQDDLYYILLRFRCHAVVMTSDITKMYRQILINERQTDFQRILWRTSTNENIKEFRLKTLTYGTASASYLAIKSLRQLALDEAHLYPEAAQIILKDFYVDDLMTGFDDENTALQIQQDVIQHLNRGCFELRKWTSNNAAVLHAVPASHRECQAPLNITSDDSVKALGIHWYPASDDFRFKIQLPPVNTNVTQSKRSVLSEISKLFDPLGWLSPVIITAKILMQQFWLLGVNWDEPLPADVIEKWFNYRNELKLLESIKIKRWIQTTKSQPIQLHGFCDASEAAYSAAVYARTSTKVGKICMTLIASKTKVAPVKQVTLPRLELCGAVLLSRLITAIKVSCPHFERSECFGWTDSLVVLAWIRKSPSNLKTFVANRVATIQSKLDPSCWRYVPSKQNPADCASRGLPASELISFTMWWSGPSFLHQKEETWPTTPSSINTALEIKKQKLITATATVEAWALLERFSTLSKLKRITAYVKRFIQNCKTKKEFRAVNQISTHEMNEALKFWLKTSQHSEYSSDISRILSGKELKRSSKLISLTPFLDEDGLLRVGGRLRHGNLPENKKHPIILPTMSPLTSLIIMEIHETLLHGGIQLMLNQIRLNYWLPRARSIIKSHIHKCISCFRQKAATSQQIMGDLPSCRIQPGRPFQNSGVDYAGPINLRISHLRNSKVTKGYIAVFVCMVTKAIHLEMVSELSTNAFMAAYNRFVSRRGNCSNIYSDNGTNFVGAKREISQVLQSTQIHNFMTNVGTNWHLIPPAAPHQGGLWEAGVKSVKHHLRRVLGTSKLTFEEMATLLCQIEACLNSRPLCQLTDDPDDINALTPGHFLIGEPLTALPEKDLTVRNINQLRRFELVQRLQQDFWIRWNKEYLSQLQNRPKWLTPHTNVEVGNLVTIRDENLPPTQWALGRIIDVHPGSDEKVRVVTIKTSNGVLKRPIQKICVLPLK